MKILINTLIATSLVLALPAQAQEIKTSAQALTLCKEMAQLNHPGYKRSSIKKIKQRRGNFSIKLKVTTDTERLTAMCEVSKSGDVNYSK